jgi:cytochrome c oxidase cbb3-type subunit III
MFVKMMPGKTRSRESGIFWPTIIFLTAILGFSGQLVGTCSFAQTPSKQSARHPAQSAPPHSDSGKGQSIFAVTCAGCHGLDARGGDRGPNIAESPGVQHLSDSQISAIISNGITGTGMPAFRSLSTDQVRALVAYLRTLQGKQETRVLPGDAKHGREIFFGKGECSSCHTISGKGGFIGPDLSGYGSTLSAKEILDAILNSNRIISNGYKPATVVTRDGTHLDGVIRNEDNFSLQLLARDGTFYFFKKSDLKEVNYGTRSLMPENYAERLSRDELNDLVSFLMTAASSRTKKPAEKGNNEDDEQ